ncbi:hypothetical protein pdam_00002933 [Pocillopora damicornis]|uniref:TOG domain-containing protein n=1 Tax=Pocillopora damicornis TaxID=46731 RepID=A0A3M6U982_POCDA|nr:hypothetical protein pdam_00002933 [Pocillopora damicornis]
MASSVAKLKPLSSVIAEPDEVLVQNMEETEVLAGLARNSDSAKKADIFDELRANARRNGGRLQFDDRHGLFQVLQEALADSDSNTRLCCIEFLFEIIPEFGEDLDSCMTLVLPLIVSNIGDNQVSVKKSAIQTLHVYMKHSSQVSAVLNAIIDHGLESDNRRTRTESLVALPILIMPNLAHEDLFTLTKALVGKLETSSRPETSPAVISLERIRNVVGSTIFESYLHRLSPDQQNLCVSALQNRSADPVKELELLGGRKAKSAGHLNTNGIISDVELPERGTVLDRGHTIAVTNTDNYPDANYGLLEFGFVPVSVMLKLRDQSNWRIRAQGIEELKTLMGQLTDTEPIQPNLGPLFALLLGFLDDVNFKIGVTSLQIIGLLVAKLGVGIRPVLKPLLLALSNKLGDNKIVIRQENMKVFMQLMQILSPKSVLTVLTSNLQHRNSRVREETVNVFIAALLTFPSSDFNLPEVTNAIAPVLVDSKRRVRQAALEAFAVIAQAMGPGRIQPVVTAVDAIELTMGGDGVMAAITARLARRQLPRLNRDGLVEYAVPMPSSGTIRGQSNTPRGADIDWILAGTAGTGSADPSGSSRSTPGPNDSFSMSGPSPRRFFSAGKNRLPWEGDQAKDVTQQAAAAENIEPIRPPMKLNSWAPMEIVNDRATKSTSQPRTTSLTTPPKSKLTTSSYAEKYHAMSIQKANQATERHVPKAAENTPGSSYAEMHRAKAKKDKSKVVNPGVNLNQTAPAGTVNSYALLYKRGTISSKAKASNSAEPAIGDHTPKEGIPRGAQSVTPTPPFSLQSSFSPGDEEPFLSSQRKPFSMSLSSSWPDWTELKSEMKPFGRLSPVSHSIPMDMDSSGEQGEGEMKKNEVPQTPIHMKPQLARSASKTRGLRATELGETKKTEIQSGVMDFLEMTPTRPTQLAPVKAGNFPPQDAFSQVHKQAELKRALKMYSVISDGEDGRSRSPSPLENNNDLPSTPLFEKGRLSKLPTKPESPFDSKPRIARTPIYFRRLSAETSLQLQSPTPLPHKFSDPDDAGLGVTGHGLLSTTVGRKTEYSPLENGVHNDDDDKHRRSSRVGSSFSGRDDNLGMGKVEVVGQGLLRLDKQLKAEDETTQLQYETEESDEGVEDDDGRDEEEDEEEEEDDHEEEEGEEGQLEDEDEDEEADSESDSEEEEYPTPSESQEGDTSTGTTTTLTSTTTSTIKSEGSSDSLGDSDEDSDSGIRENIRDMTPKTMRKSLSKSTRERMERRRQEEEEKLQKEQERFAELEKERMKQLQVQREEEEKLRQKILKEQVELGKMLNRKEKERELERQKQQQLQEELQRQEKALRDRLLKQQEELEEIEQEKQRERERRLKERMRQKQKQKEAKLLRAEKEREQEEEIRRQLAEKEAELKKKQLQRAKELKIAAEPENTNLSVSGSSSPLKSNKKPPTGTPKKKAPVSSTQSERDSSYAVTDDPSEIRRHHAASAGSTSAQCWEISLDDLQPFNNPENALREAMKYLANTEDWEMKCEGIQGIRRLTKHHPEVLVSQLHTVTLAIIAEVKNLRSQVSRSGICCLGDMYTILGKNMDNELEVTAKILLAKAGESSGFIREDVEKALTAMVSSLTPTRLIVALISGGASHRNVTVRKTTAQFLSMLADRMGPSRVMSGAKDVTEKILPTTAQFLTDGGQETRYYGRKILSSICDHPEFDKHVSKHVPSNLQKSVRDTVDNLRTKGLGEPPSDLSSSARQRKPASGGGGSRSGGVRGSVAASPSSNSSSREPSRSGKPVTRDGLIQGEETIPNLINSLQASDWKERQQAIDQFVDLVQLNPDGSGQKFTKVNLYALQCLPKILHCLANQSTALVPPMVAALTSNFASKNTNIFSAAEEALDEFIKHIDKTLLVQPFCSTAQFGSSRVKPIMVDKLADIVSTVHTRKPQVVSRHILPLLWSLLNTASNSSAGAGNSALKTSTSRLTSTLYSCMGRSLTEQASNQVPRIQEKLHEIIGS